GAEHPRRRDHLQGGGRCVRSAERLVGFRPGLTEVAVPADAAVTGYLEHVIVEKGLSTNTVAAYRRDLDRFENWLDEVGVDDLASLSPAQLGDFIAWASRDAGLSASSVRRTMSSVRGLF